MADVCLEINQVLMYLAEYFVLQTTPENEVTRVNSQIEQAKKVLTSKKPSVWTPFVQ